MKQKPFLVLILVLSCVLCVGQNEFHLENGAGFEDNTLIYLDDITPSAPLRLDSALIITNNFSFEGTNKDPAKQVLLRVTTRQA